MGRAARASEADREGPVSEAALEPERGTCFGYAVRSALPLECLRAGTSDRVLSIDEWEGQSEPQPLGELLEESAPGDGLRGAKRTYRSGSSFLVWMDFAGWFRIDPEEPSILAPRSPHPLWLEGLIWGLPTALCLLGRGDLVFHGAAAEVEGRALLLTAPGGHGKTTLAAAFLQAGHRLLAEDLACCENPPSPSVVPGPALLRLRHDVADHFRIPGTRVAGVDTGKTYLVVDEEERGDGGPVPLSAVVILRPSDGEVRLERVDPLSGLPDLWAVSLNIPDDAGRTRCFQNLADLAAAVPVWNLSRPRTIEALGTVVEELVETCLSI